MRPKRIRGRRALAVLLLPLAAPLAAPLGAQEVASLEGDWLGTLSAGGQQLRLLFHVTVAEDGTASGTMDSLDQGANGIPVTEVTLEDGTVRMAVPVVGGGFQGQLSESGDAIEGTWSQGGASFPLTVERTAEAPEGPERPQEPSEPLPYASEDVTFSNADAGVELAGTLTVPRGQGPFPAVALVSGSGPQDRNETVFGHRPFLVLSDHLTRAGIAVLRYDDRGVGSSTGDFAAATSQDFAGDALAAVAYLRSRPEVDPGSVGIAGHSEGGLIAPMAATRSDHVAFIVLMAGPGITGEEILYLQGELIALAAGTPRDLVEKNTEAQRQLFAVLRETPDPDAARAEAEEVFESFFASLEPGELAALGVTGDPEEYARNQINQLLSPWFRFFLTYDPVDALRRVQVPVLAINGEKDLQVPPRENLQAIEAALREGGNPDVTIRELEDLNHLFQTSSTGAPSEYAAITETMSPAALEAVSTWILSRTDGS